MAAGVGRHKSVDLTLVQSDEGAGIAEIAVQSIHPSPESICSTASLDRVGERLRAVGQVFEKLCNPVRTAREVMGLAWPA
jgi:hypothetical protein